MSEYKPSTTSTMSEYKPSTTSSSSMTSSTMTASHYEHTDFNQHEANDDYDRIRLPAFHDLQHEHKHETNDDYDRIRLQALYDLQLQHKHKHEVIHDLYHELNRNFGLQAHHNIQHEHKHEVIHHFQQQQHHFHNSSVELRLI
ncbi:hypothetical protein LTS09_010033 [Friedmanniomyces endolithicus]|nr:hypothetical protein LTS09_010033 [Friedmanniomyces endolithicus]